ncbi:DUF2505 domain-containing protein [Brachybacterium hainanense]|uniref:DUF2505 domain-containing protein n=1 Tax=Brachybacterium hainanense TaxID=1541174 RepID=A0ABV6RBX7_9MICO
MKLTETLSLPLPAQDVAAMYADPRYAQVRGEVLGAQSASSRVEGDVAGAFTVSTELSMPTDRVPDIARPFVGSSITVREVQSWSAPQADGARTGTTDLVVVGTPASMTAAVTMTPAQTGTTEIVIDGDLVAKIPVLGKRLEKAALPYVSRVLKAEQKAARTYREGAGS